MFILFLYAVLYFSTSCAQSSSCSDSDSQCDEGFYCSNSKRCEPCIDCVELKRITVNSCAKHVLDCGQCIPDFTVKEGMRKCIPMLKDSNENGKNYEKGNEYYIDHNSSYLVWLLPLVIGVIVLLVGGLTMLYIFYKQRPPYTNPTADNTELTHLKQPPPYSMHVQSPTAPPYSDEERSPYNNYNVANKLASESVQKAQMAGYPSYIKPPIPSARANGSSYVPVDSTRDNLPEPAETAVDIDNPDNLQPPTALVQETGPMVQRDNSNVVSRTDQSTGNSTSNEREDEHFANHCRGSYSGRTPMNGVVVHVNINQNNNVIN